MVRVSAHTIHAALAHRRVAHPLHPLPGLGRAAAVRHHDPVGATFEQIHNFLIALLPDADHQIDTRGAAGQRHRLDRAGFKRPVLEVVPDHVVADAADHLGQPQIGNTADSSGENMPAGAELAQCAAVSHWA